MANVTEAIEMLECAEYNLDKNFPKLGSAIIAPVLMQIREAIKLLEGAEPQSPPEVLEQDVAK